MEVILLYNHILRIGENMILEKYLKQNDLNIRQLHLITNIPESTFRSLNDRDISK